MPMHDWSRVTPGTYHNFHVLWLATITNQLNAGILPAGCFAMAEQVIGGPEPDVVTLNLGMIPPNHSGSAAILAQPRPKPRTSVVMMADEDRYVRKANRIVVRHELGEVLAVIELVSPGNKNSVHAIRSLVDKLVELLFDRVNLLVIDPLPPTPRDPQGIHALIWNEVTDQPFQLPPDRPLTMAAYQAEPTKTAWVEPIAVGSALPSMPLFLRGEYYVDLPLEPSYMETWNVLPQQLKQLVTAPASR
jgi:hypothetical protein